LLPERPAAHARHEEAVIEALELELEMGCDAIGAPDVGRDRLLHVIAQPLALAARSPARASSRTNTESVSP
jgi:hypothetical protein